jgi:hypothetical protein
MINLRNSSLNDYHGFLQGIGSKFNLYTYSVSPTLVGTIAMCIIAIFFHLMVLKEK